MPNYGNPKLLQHIHGLNSFFGIFDHESNYLFINKTGADWLGFKNPESAIGKSHFDINCPAVELAPVWVAQDKKTLAGVQERFVGFNCYAGDSWRFVLVQKSIYNDDQGHTEILCQVSDITHTSLSSASHFIYKEFLSSSQFKRKQFSYVIDEKFCNTLSKRQSECLFFLLRGKTSKEIAKYVGLSYRTVEKHIEGIKLKFSCETRNQLIEKSIAEGFFNFIPETLWT